MQITDTILMVRPAAFGANEQTATTNFFQSTGTKTDPGPSAISPERV